MTISETILLLAGGTAILAILFGIRLAMRAAAGGGSAALRPRGWAGPAGGSRAPDVPGVIALPPLIFLGFLAAAAVLEAVVPLPLLAAHSFPRYLAGAALAAGGFVLIAMGAQRFLAAGTNIPPTLPTTALAVDGIYRWTRNPLYLGSSLVYLGFGVAAGKHVGNWARRAAHVGDPCRRRGAGRALSGAQVRRCLPLLQGAGAAVDLMRPVFTVRADLDGSSAKGRFLP
jgi:Phospholipid methyltransferase